MNRILFEPEEVTGDEAVFGGVRARHAVDVLHAEVGSMLKTGILNGPAGSSRITRIEKTPPTGDEPEGGYRIQVTCSHTDKAPEPWVDVILAPPRPRVLKRLLPQMATMGVGRLTLVGAAKVEKAFWGAQLLKERVYHPLLVEGLMQAGTTRVPEIRTRRNFKAYVADELPEEVAAASVCLVAHPYGGSSALPTARQGMARAEKADEPSRRLLLAIGPEGGWLEEEVALLEKNGFRRYSLGGRILRTDTATIALLARCGMTDDFC